MQHLYRLKYWLLRANLSNLVNILPKMLAILCIIYVDISSTLVIRTTDNWLCFECSQHSRKLTPSPETLQILFLDPEDYVSITDSVFLNCKYILKASTFTQYQNPMQYGDLPFRVTFSELKENWELRHRWLKFYHSSRDIWLLLIIVRECSLVVSNLRSETKGYWFEFGC